MIDRVVGSPTTHNLVRIFFLQDQGLERIAPALARANALFERRLRDPLRVRDAIDRLIPDANGDGVAHADVVIEAIFESVEAKHALFKAVEPRMKPGALLATNTSSLRLEELRMVLAPFTGGPLRYRASRR